MSQRTALSAYRNSMRATRLAFNNDLLVLKSARDQIRSEMKLQTSPSNPLLKINERVDLLNQISEFLRHNIVQGVKNGNSNGKEKYLLNIHNNTELGDNEEIRTTSNLNIDGSPMAGSSCCGGGKVELKQK